MGTLRIVAWNCEVNRPTGDVVQGLRNLIHDADPDVLCLQEAGGYVQAIRNNFGVDAGGAFRVYAHNDWKEANNCPVLVHKRFASKTRGDPNGWDTVRCSTGWEGPHGHKHPGRTWTWAKVDSRYVMSLHRATGYKAKNKAASKDEYQVLCDWLDDRRDQKIVVLGDHNMDPKSTDPYWTSKCAANHVSGSTRYDGSQPGIDYAICRNQKAKSVKRTKTYGSDHKAVVFVTDP